MKRMRMRGGVFYEDERNEATRGDEEKYKTKRGKGRAKLMEGERRRRREKGGKGKAMVQDRKTGTW